MVSAGTKLSASLGCPVLNTNIDTSISTKGADNLYVGLFPGPKYLGMKESKVEGLNMPAGMSGGASNMAKDRMDSPINQTGSQY